MKELLKVMKRDLPPDPTLLQSVQVGEGPNKNLENQLEENHSEQGRDQLFENSSSQHFDPQPVSF